MLAVFQSVEEVGNIGSVRSARDYYVSLAMGHDALYLHAGGAPGPMPPSRTGGGALTVSTAHTRALCSGGTRSGGGAWAWSTACSPPEQTISELMPTYSYRLEHKEGYQYPAAFLAEGEKAQGNRGTGSAWNSPPIRPGCSPISRRPGLSGGGVRRPYLDGNTGEQVAVKNILVLRTDVSGLQGDDAGRLSVRTTGTGTGQLFCDGRCRTSPGPRPSTARP